MSLILDNRRLFQVGKNWEGGYLYSDQQRVARGGRPGDNAETLVELTKTRSHWADGEPTAPLHEWSSWLLSLLNNILCQVPGMRQRMSYLVSDTSKRQTMFLYYISRKKQSVEPIFMFTLPRFFVFCFW